MARRSVRVTANVRKSQETRSQTRPLSTFPYVQNAPSVVQARLRGVRARRRLLRRASAGHDKKINKNKLNRDSSYGSVGSSSGTIAPVSVDFCLLTVGYF